ncbi:hypothetical protein CVT24_010461 [Panaeolus cyanescens]|uniref:G domain-containing protein n=1 Tax=Panaeolus cyanescens TaxID=181874 RepID=A0A409YQG5_9AGAR|nr:hypothetical protein CVT24_010461 [Panaeolus cyanescens]
MGILKPFSIYTEISGARIGVSFDSDATPCHDMLEIFEKTSCNGLITKLQDYISQRHCERVWIGVDREVDTHSSTNLNAVKLSGHLEDGYTLQTVMTFIFDNVVKLSKCQYVTVFYHGNTSHKGSEMDMAAVREGIKDLVGSIFHNDFHPQALDVKFVIKGTQTFETEICILSILYHLIKLTDKDSATPQSQPSDSTQLNIDFAVENDSEDGFRGTKIAGLVETIRMGIIYGRRIKAIGEVSIERSTAGEGDYGECSPLLLLGTTGSGKSSFVEALAGSNHKLGLSGGGLESVTQDIDIFKIHSVIAYRPGSLDWDVYVADSPGFSDNKMSEVQIVRRIYQFQCANLCKMDHAFYFHRITDKRIPGSSRRIIHLLKALQMRPINLTIITTMWDNIHGAEAMKRAESNFEELRDIVWKDEIKNGATIVKFENTQASAVDILVSTIIAGGLNDDLFYLNNRNPAGPALFHELLERLDVSRKRKNALLEEKIRLFSNPHPELESIVVSDLEDAEENLAHHLSQVMTYRQSPPGFEDIFQSIIYQHLLDIVVSAQHFAQTIINTLAGFSSTDRAVAPRSKLEKALKTAQEDFQLAYATLRDYGPPPPGSKPFIPSTTKSTAENVHAESTLAITQCAVDEAVNAIDQMPAPNAPLDAKPDMNATIGVNHLPTPSLSLVADISNPSVSPSRVSIDQAECHALEAPALVLKSNAKRGLGKKIKFAFYNAVQVYVGGERAKSAGFGFIRPRFWSLAQGRGTACSGTAVSPSPSPIHTYLHTPGRIVHQDHMSAPSDRLIYNSKEATALNPVNQWLVDEVCQRAYSICVEYENDASSLVAKLRGRLLGCLVLSGAINPKAQRYISNQVTKYAATDGGLERLANIYIKHIIKRLRNKEDVMSLPTYDEIQDVLQAHRQEKVAKAQAYFASLNKAPESSSANQEQDLEQFEKNRPEL